MDIENFACQRSANYQYIDFQKRKKKKKYGIRTYILGLFNPLPNILILGSSNSAANKDVKNMDKF